jgi:enamine deaminase RidA (YjgF/YER057c/UK114 family)
MADLRPFAGPAAMHMGPLTFFAGMLGLDAGGRLVREARELDDPVAGHFAADLDRYAMAPGFATQSFAAWRILAEVCRVGGRGLDDLIKLTVTMRDPRDLWIFEEVRAAFLPGPMLPAVEFVAVPGPGPVAEAAVQIEAIASVDVADVAVTA